MIIFLQLKLLYSGQLSLAYSDCVIVAIFTILHLSTTLSFEFENVRGHPKVRTLRGEWRCRSKAHESVPGGGSGDGSNARTLLELFLEVIIVFPLILAWFILFDGVVHSINYWNSWHILETVIMFDDNGNSWHSIALKVETARALRGRGGLKLTKP